MYKLKVKKKKLTEKKNKNMIQIKQTEKEVLQKRKERKPPSKMSDLVRVFPHPSSWQRKDYTPKADEIDISYLFIYLAFLNFF